MCVYAKALTKREEKQFLKKKTKTNKWECKGSYIYKAVLDEVRKRKERRREEEGEVFKGLVERESACACACCVLCHCFV